MQIPLKRRLASNDPFFNEGNEECAQCIHKVHVEDDIDFVIDSIDAHRVEEFACDIVGCKETFRNPMGYNRHYDMVHRYRCQHCSRNFPCNYLLGLHVQENHDSFFAAQTAQGLPVFHCLLEICAARFASTDDRLEHMVKVHKYPSDFRYNTTKRKHVKYQDKKMKKHDSMEIQTEVENGDLGVGKSSSDRSVDMDNEKEGGSAVECGATVDSKCGDVLNVLKTKDLSNSRNSGGTSTQDNDATMDVDREVSRSEPVKTEKKRHIPKNITFGRGAHRGFARSRYK